MNLGNPEFQELSSLAHSHTRSPGAKELITEAVVDNLLSWRHSGFSAHDAVRVEDRQVSVRLGCPRRRPHPRAFSADGALLGLLRQCRPRQAPQDRTGRDIAQTPRRQNDDELTRRARLTWAKLTRSLPHP